MIIGQSFQNITGGGITLSNLFDGWHCRDIALAASYKSIVKSNIKYCENLFILGKEEMWNIWPLCYFVNKHDSGQYLIPANSTKSQEYAIHRFHNIKSILTGMLFWILHKVGIYHASSKLRVSSVFLKWFDEFDPDIVYTQLSTYDLILFIKELQHKRRFKLIIHMMDDWPSTIVKRGLFSYHWEKRIDRDLKELIRSADLFLTISEAMKDDYQKRYLKNSVAFHNPVNLDLYRNDKDVCIKNVTRILYTGRIGIANKKSLSLFIDTIESTTFPIPVEFHIYSPDYHNNLKLIKGKKKIFMHKPVDHPIILKLLSEFDILLLPLDFTKEGVRFARLSMPSKASEYMASGTPIIVMASQETALAKHAIFHRWAVVIKAASQKAIKSTIFQLIENEDIRKDIATKAKNYADAHFCKKKINHTFFTLIDNL